MTVNEYWAGSRFVAEWTITDDLGAPVSGATVIGTVDIPDPPGGTASMAVTTNANVHTFGYTAQTAGRHVYRLTAAGVAVGAQEGSFVVQRSAVGLPAITVDPTTDIGLVRLLATDLDEVEPLFEDEQIAAFLTAEGGNVKLAAALALETIARSYVLIAKKITTQDLSTDGPAVAKELRESAAALRAQASTTTTVAASSALLPLYSFPTPAAWGDLNL